MKNMKNCISNVISLIGINDMLYMSLVLLTILVLFLALLMLRNGKEIKYYQPIFAKWISSNYWEYIAEYLSAADMSIITKVMNAHEDGDCSWLVWHECDRILKQIEKHLKVWRKLQPNGKLIK